MDKQGDNLTPIDIAKFAAAYGTWLKRKSDNLKVIIGRDGRVSGEMVTRMVAGTLQKL